MDLDAIFVSVGEFGRYQQLLFFLLCLPTILLDGVASYVQVFLGASPEHWCLPSALDSSLFSHLNLSVGDGTETSIKNLTIPTELDHDGDTAYSSCAMFDVNFTAEYVQNGERLPGRNESWPEVHCRYGWYYDTSVYRETIITQWDLVCTNDYFQSIMLMLVTFGGVLGTFIFGYLNDTFGRRKSYFICWFVMALSMCITPFSVNIMMFAITRVCSGIAVTPIYQIIYVHMMEFVGPNKRTMLSQLMSIGYAFGYMVLAGAAYLLRDWRDLSLAVAVPWLPLLLWWFWFPESPRWLLTQGRVKEAEKIIRVMAKVNGKHLPKDFLQSYVQVTTSDSRDGPEDAEELTDSVDFRDHNTGVAQETSGHFDKSQQSVSTAAGAGLTVSAKFAFSESLDVSNIGEAKYIELVKTPTLRIITICVTISWIGNIMVYDGLSYLTTELDVDDFLTFFTYGAVEIPAYILCWILVDRVGRKWPMILSMGICAMGILLIAAIPASQSWLIFALSTVGKLGISFGYTLIYLYASELFPTSLRGRGVSFASNIAHLIDMLTPYVIYLQKFGRLIPFFILGALSACGGLCILLLPETLHQILPETVFDVEHRYRIANFWKWSRKPKNEEVVSGPHTSRL